ncbi:Single-stranded-DNA-specific exonuclease RecJ [Rubripirellula lacrimiformis]|uniref:Single-stranded-DNA-specific exonuclease RecJ n=1 Tax=Rubripirellula lacrimiformis TaxID=1930273 RepID=A0A517NL20_9BACT|nr:single-stranded-DNA-specific exonuclease RecJ [Rubripirellula lacrimiformis]QDT07837.1 Single-stranded-DNA-specific exonuclease RecJ [Rubripirellula lacrimiformis]
MQRKWRIIPHDSSRVEMLMREARVPAVVAQVLVSRGVYTAADASQFLDTKLKALREPLLLPGVPEATKILVAAIRAKTPIVIYGDYDCDGMTGAAILVNGFRLLGGDVSYHVPNRLEDGYGLNENAIRKLAKHGKKVIVSVDCGITSVSHAKLCKELGITLVITDHHTIGDELPDADAIVHPRLPGTAYPFGELCGAGVAFKLAWAMCQDMCGSKKVTEPLRRYLMQSLALAGIGTIADVVPLLDENRILVEHGLKMLQAEPLPGLAELMKILKLDEATSLDTDSIAFAIAPRLNAAGRLGQAQLAVELLTTPAGDRAKALAEYIHELNNSRDTLQRSVYLAAQKQAKNDFNIEEDAALVLAGVGWHQGVIGVVAGRLAEKYAKPVLVISQDAAGKVDAVGSGRVGGTNINLYEALAECSERLVRFGGHKAAAGLTIDERQLDAFRGDFCEAVARQWAENDVVPEIVIDAEAPLGQLNLESIKQIEMLAPFGAGNPRPILCCRDVRLDTPATLMGKTKAHLTVNLRQGNKVIRAVAFGCSEWCDELNTTDGPIEIAYRPVINEFRGFRKVEIHLVDWQPTKKPATV